MKTPLSEKAMFSALVAEFEKNLRQAERRDGKAFGPDPVILAQRLCDPSAEPENARHKYDSWVVLNKWLPQKLSKATGMSPVPDQTASPIKAAPSPVQSALRSVLSIFTGPKNQKWQPSLPANKSRETIEADLEKVFAAAIQDARATAHKMPAELPQIANDMADRLINGDASSSKGWVWENSKRLRAIGLNERLGEIETCKALLNRILDPVNEEGARHGETIAAGKTKQAFQDISRVLRDRLHGFDLAEPHRRADYERLFNEVAKAASRYMAREQKDNDGETRQTLDRAIKDSLQAETSRRIAHSSDLLRETLERYSDDAEALAAWFRTSDAARPLDEARAAMLTDVRQKLHDRRVALLAEAGAAEPDGTAIRGPIVAAYNAALRDIKKRFSDYAERSRTKWTAHARTVLEPATQFLHPAALDHQADHVRAHHEQTAQAEIAATMRDTVDRLDASIVEQLMPAVFDHWFRSVWEDPLKRWQRFRRSLVASTNNDRKGIEYIQLDNDFIRQEAHHNLALGSAIHAIDRDGSTRLQPDVCLALLVQPDGEDEQTESSQHHTVTPDDRNTDCWSYLDWAQSMSGSDRVSDTLATCTFNLPPVTRRQDENDEKLEQRALRDCELEVKVKLNQFVKDFIATPGDEFIDKAHFTPLEIEPISSWIMKTGRSIDVAIDRDGLIAIVVSPETVESPDARRGLTDKADNAAIVIAHIVRRALGDHVAAGEPHGDRTRRSGIAYRIAPGEFVPVPLAVASDSPILDEPTDRDGMPVDCINRSGRGANNIGKTSKEYLNSSDVVTVKQLAEIDQTTIERIVEWKPYMRNKIGDWIARAQAMLSIAPQVPKPETPSGKAAALLDRDALPRHFVRKDWVACRPLAPRSAIVALAERSVTRRNELFAAVDKAKREGLDKPNMLPVHAALLAAIAGFFGVFAGCLFGETILSALDIARNDAGGVGQPFNQFFFPAEIDRDALAKVAEQTGWTLQALAVVCLTVLKSLGVFGLTGLMLWIGGAWYITASARRTRKFGFAFFLTAVGALFFAIASMRVSPDTITPHEAAFFGFILFLMSIIAFAWCMRYEYSVENLISLETFSPQTDGFSEPAYRTFRGRALKVFLWTAPFLLLGWGLLFDLDDAPFSNTWADSAAARYDDNFSSLAWALPVLSFGILISAWNRFGESGVVTLTHDIILRRLKHCEGAIRGHIPLAAMLQQRLSGMSGPKPDFIDMEKAAGAITPHTELIVTHQEGTRAGFLRRTALVATAVLAVLQIDAFKSLEPTEARNVDGASDTAILTHALFTALDANGSLGQDNGEKPSDVQAAILTQRMRELVGGLRTAALMNEATIRATLDTGQVRRTSISQNDTDVDLHRLSAGMQRTFEKPGTGRQTVWDGGPITAAITNLATTIGTWRPVKVTRVNWPDGGNLNDTIAKSVAEKFRFDQSAINWSSIGSGIGTSLAISPLNINWEVFSDSLAKGFVAELGKSGIDWDVAVTGLTDGAAANLEAATVDWTKIGLRVTETLGAKINWQDPANTISGGIADNIKNAAIDWPALVKGLVLNVNLDDFDLDPAAIREHLAHPTDAAEKPPTENVTGPRSFSPSSLFTSIPPECGDPEGSHHLVARFQYRFERSGITADDVDCVWTGDGTPPRFSRCEQDGYDTLKRAGNRPDDNGTIGAIRQKLGKTWQDEATRYQYILVAGFTDLQGPTLTNIRLSQQRAQKLSYALQSGWEWLAEGNRRPPIIAIGLGQEIDTSAASGGNMINVPGSRRAEVRMCGLPKAAQSSASALADATQGVEKPAPSTQPSKNAPKTTQVVE